MMPPVTTPATNPLADLIQEPVFLDLVIERPSVAMSDLPDVLREFSRRDVYFDSSGLERLIDTSASFAVTHPDLANSAKFVVVPADLWRTAQNELPISADVVPSDLVWAEPGFRDNLAVIVPNTNGSELQIMLYREATPFATTRRRFFPVRFPLEPAGEPGDVPTECVLDWSVDGEYATLDCAGSCARGGCVAHTYHVEGRPEVVAGCYCG